ncbi:MAG: 4Fe-4S dicluster domain-containing protein [Gemmatimonadota bacterium]|nr:4Fe-4S dicluster domain-containing protein [Gemmatimonadota bacterium]
MSTETESKGIRRRDFLKVVGGGVAVAASIGCESDRVEKLIPYLVSPDHTVPGVGTYYATTCRGCAASCGVIAETLDGRTTKLEGNPAHPLNRGALCAAGQAELQALYNPDRYRSPMIRKGGKLVAVKWDDALRLFSQKLGETRSRGAAGGAAFINQHESGSFPAFLDQWLADFGMQPHISYDSGVDAGAIAAHSAAYGVAWPRFDFNAASLVVSFGADFLDGWGPSVPQQLDWADARAKLKGAPRLIYVGARRSLTGLNADTWLDCKPGTESAIARALSGEMVVQQAAQASGVDAGRLQSAVDEYRSARPALVLAAGNVVNSADLFTTVASLNKAGGAIGATIRPDQAITAYEGVASGDELRALSNRMNAGSVSLVMVRGANPVYTMPKSTGFATAFAKVPFKVSFATVMNDTSEMCDLILPDHHSLEQWGDAQPLRGTLSLQQPSMDPVFDSRATSDVLITVAKGDPANAAKYAVADYRDWLISKFPGGAAALAKALPTAIVAGTAMPRANRSVPVVAATTATATAAPAITATTGDLFLFVYHHPVIGDGRGANKPWLQELPDPVTKITWQTVVEMHPLTAGKMGLDNSDLVTVTTSAGKLTAPVYLYLGIRQDTIAVAAGRGQMHAGRYAKSGENAYDLLPAGGTGAVSLVSTRASLARAGGSVLLATTEGSARQHLRDIARATTVDELARGPEPEEEHLPGDASHAFLPGLRSPVANDAQGEFGDPNSKNKGMYEPDHWSNMAKRRWAMTVDLARCTGCAACVTACYAENNIPTVGAEWQGGQIMPDRTGFGANITRSREMAWLRLERYYEGGEDGSADFETRFIPMMCQHCGNAPCEPVCPVYATYHAPDGLNVQVYNRCVGTRYCSNNCPYKVRYFNWFGYGEPHRPQYAFPEPLNWQLNPDVTVRGKGVMEKCSMCVQRIRGAEHRAKLENRPLRPDEFTTACAESCPSRAITFGDASDESWSVTRLIKDERAYHVFEELNTYTAVVYLKKVNHPAPATAPAHA